MSKTPILTSCSRIPCCSEDSSIAMFQLFQYTRNNSMLMHIKAELPLVKKSFSGEGLRPPAPHGYPEGLHPQTPCGFAGSAPGTAGGKKAHASDVPSCFGPVRALRCLPQGGSAPLQLRSPRRWRDNRRHIRHCIRHRRFFCRGFRCHQRHRCLIHDQETTAPQGC